MELYIQLSNAWKNICLSHDYLISLPDQNLSSAIFVADLVGQLQLVAIIHTVV